MVDILHIATLKESLVPCNIVRVPDLGNELRELLLVGGDPLLQVLQNLDLDLGQVGIWGLG